MAIKRLRMIGGKLHNAYNNPNIKVIKAVHPKGQDGKRNGPILIPGSIIETDPKNIKGFLDLWEQLSDAGEVVSKDPVEEEKMDPKLPLEKIEREGGWYVVNTATGEPINDDPLTEEEADDFISDNPDPATKKTPQQLAEIEDLREKKAAKEAAKAKKKTTAKKKLAKKKVKK